MQHFHSPQPASGDFDRLASILPRLDALPFSFRIGNSLISGIPQRFMPTIEEAPLPTGTRTIIRGTDPASGISVTFEMDVLTDFPSVEWVVYLENTSTENTPLITNLYAAQLNLPASDPILASCNGDGVGAIGYHTTYIPLTPQNGNQHIMPKGGRPCSGAFPYFSVQSKDFGYHLIVGWSGQWMVDFNGCADHFTFAAKQAHTNFYLMPGEKIRTPRILLLAFEGDEMRGINLWRRYYMAHVMPKPYPAFPEPLVFCHEADRPGAEWTQATEEGQVRCLKGFLKRGMKFNAWWIDAGWFPCGGDWGNTGPWYPDPERFPRRMKPIGDACAENNIRFLLWFEPERTRMPSRDPNWKDEWLLDWVRVNGEGDEEISLQYLYDLGNEEARAYMTDKIDKVIKEAGVKIFRSDYNILPWGHWTCNEKWNRRGITENHYVCGYLQMWKDLSDRNPGMLIDSCASGGQRNDLETMRLSVPFQYTDCGIGANEPFKCAFSRTMFAWLPYFRQHSGYWGGGMDNYAYHLAMVPALTFLMPHTAPQETVDYCIAMAPIHDRAARMMLRADYYPLLPDSRSHESAYAIQFDDHEAGEGLVQVIRHEHCESEAITLKLYALDPSATYTFTSPEFARTLTLSGASLLENGFTVSIPKRSGEIWFYEKA